MSKHKAKNEKTKRRYFKFLQEAEGYSIKTIESIEKAIWDYETFTEEDDYASFNEKNAQEFKKWLSIKKVKDGNPISLATQHQRLRLLKKFFTWLSGQNGYKSKVSSYDASYLRMEKTLARQAISPKVEDYPKLEDIKKLCESIEIKNEIDKRDRALIAFTLLSGMRDKAIITLPLGCFNEITHEVTQDPKYGVETKFSKQIQSVLFPFDDILTSYVIDWAKYLREEKKFSNSDPLFPSTKVEQMSEYEYIFEVKGVEPIYWKSTSTIRKIFEHRAKNADLKYYSPHKFRHTATREATDRCRNAEQIKAVSQNLGHEHVGTTLITYGRLASPRVKDVVRSLDFSEETMEKDKAIEQIEKILHKLAK